jgi:carotenoid phi-ring synthase / carotenoid chi-ring synthase
VRAEYLLFNLVIGLPPLLLAFWRRAYFVDRLGPALWACVIAAAPFVVWDVLVTGRHWWFDPRYTLGVHLFGLPVEELSFFVTVPFACLFMWEQVLAGHDARPRAWLRLTHALSWTMLLPASIAAVMGLEYTALVLASWACAAALDHALGTMLLRTPRFWAFLGIVASLTLVFNGYLTARPVVHYDPTYQLDLRVGTIPIEDFVFGIALVTTVLIVFSWRSGRTPARSWIAHGIRRRLGGYRHRITRVDETRPHRLACERRIAVIGGGLAGMGAAAELAERGFRVTLIERNPYLGGKIAGWHEQLDDGFETRIEHGFHAFFRHYYNLNGFLERVGAHGALRSIGDYVIQARDGRRFSFARVNPTPGLNLLSLARHGLYDLRRVAFGPAGRQLETFLRYDAEDTLRRWDDVSFETFAQRARLPDDLRLVFTTFSRAFFADAARISMAELVKSFHFYYLSHDHGLVYDYVHGDVQRCLIEPIERHLTANRVQIRCGTSVDVIERIEHTRAPGFRVAGSSYDAVVLATDVAASRAIVERSAWIGASDPVVVHRMHRMRAGQRYAVLRVWLDERASDDLPVFVTTERKIALDAVAFVHRIDPDAASWADERDGSVLELHCYAVPDDLPDAELEDVLVGELRAAFPALRRARLVHTHVQIRNDFTAFHVGLGHDRPSTRTAIEGLVLAGDWVRLPCPAMLMEAAYTSGLLAANVLCEAQNLRLAPVDTVPVRGLL